MGGTIIVLGVIILIGFLFNRYLNHKEKKDSKDV